MADCPIKCPPLEKVRYIKDGDEPNEMWKQCNQLLKQWQKVREAQGNVAIQAMQGYKKKRALNMVWWEKRLKDGLPEGIDDKKTFKILEKIYCKFADASSADEHSLGSPTDAEKDRQSAEQLIQHMKAYVMLCDTELSKPLSTTLIKSVHAILMFNMKDEDGKPLIAGEYRDGSVHADFWSFPDPGCVHAGMERIVSKYNEERAKPDHDMYSLASWLLYEFVTLHPFQDGNGRMCRLLWCYSLMKDGLPFPATISSGHKKAHKHYVEQILADRSRVPGATSHARQPHLTTLTVVAIHRLWCNFIENLRFQQPELHQNFTSHFNPST